MICKTCGKEFKRRGTQGPAPNYCYDKCRISRANEAKAKWWAKQDPALIRRYARDQRERAKYKRANP